MTRAARCRAGCCTHNTGTTTPAITKTDRSAATNNTNPIVLDAAGRPPYQIWLDVSFGYTLTLKTSVGVQIWSEDDIYSAPGISGLSAVADTFVATSGQTVFTLSANPGDIDNMVVTLDGSTLTPTTDFVWDGAITVTLGTGAIAAGGTVLTLVRGDNAAFTAAGTKGFVNFTATYILN